MALPYFDAPSVFTSAECDAIVTLGARGPLEPATVWNGVENHVDTRTRHAERCYWPRAAETAWIHDRLDALFAEAAARFETEVDPVFEDIQLIRYGVGAHFQTWHSDAGTDRYDARRISASIELSEASDYEGGVLEIAPALGLARTLPRGGARLFASRMIHRVTPVTRGVRYALVAWTGKSG
ncbi:MAG: 2OG-Fe(II) oxygenase [Sphingomonas sp.]|uniref:2OG-Fe(II) oxygenase n=1 Tax=Sphingomonas sp. TaxID=28214 RepID=UPI002273B152|nr:2OG-Fe(II) oxygenase [Sphingomonas sp.]MCX8477582.1 2OG-Fe(II) oxygenase [Sphingomonas sp.]